MDLLGGLRTFLKVAERGSFTSAALDLGLTQPAVSRQVTALEAHFRTRLLHRNTSGIALTAEGMRMVAMAQGVIEGADALAEAIAPASSPVEGRVRLSLPAPLGLFIAERLPGLLAIHPRLMIELVQREAPSDLVGEGLDLEVRLGDVADSGLICRRIGATTAHLVASPAYLLSRNAPENPAEIIGHDCLCYVRGGEKHAWQFASGDEIVEVMLCPRLLFDNAVAAHRSALAGGGLAVLSHLLVAGDLAAGRLVDVMSAYPPVRLPITVVYPSRRHLALRVRRVLDFLTEALKADVLLGSAPGRAMRSGARFAPDAVASV